MHDMVILIPARSDSKRFPQKLLKPIAGKSILQRSYAAGRRVGVAISPTSRVCVVAGDGLIADHCDQHDIPYIYSEGAHIRNGTERVADACDQMMLQDDQLVVNLQADTFGRGVPKMIEYLYHEFNHMDSVLTPCQDSLIPEQCVDPSVVKTTGVTGDTPSYFTRTGTPRQKLRRAHWYRHYGIYMAKAALFRRYARTIRTIEEETVSLEQLRWKKALNVNLRSILCPNVEKHVHDVNTEEDYNRVQAFYQSRHWFNGACGGGYATLPPRYRHFIKTELEGAKA